jgi:hypothetical protein
MEYFENPEFYKVYTHLYWTECSNTELKNAATRLYDNYLKPNISPDPKVPINLLVLGVGIGTLDFPLIFEIARVANRKVHLFCIDKSSFALSVIKALFNKIIELESLNLTENNVAEAINITSESASISTESYPVSMDIRLYGSLCLKLNLILDDLDFNGHGNTTAPSLWSQNLKEHPDFPTDGFDLIISSLCTFQLKWWRKKIVDSFYLLKEQGLLIHGHLGGDEYLFEGKSLAVSSRAQRFIGEKLFKQFYQDLNIKKFMSRPRLTSATSPEAILQMIESLKGIEIVTKNLDYQVISRIGFDDYIFLVKTKGFSTFRLVEKMVGEEKYERVVREIEENPQIRNSQNDTLIFEMKWSVYKKNSNHEFLTSNIVRKFIPSLDKRSDFCPDFDREAVSSRKCSPSIIGNDLDEDTFAEHIAQEMTTGGLLDPKCIAVELGFIKSLGQPIKYCFFTNPFHLPEQGVTVNEFKKKLRLFLSTVVYRYSFNSAGVSLLKNLVPYSAKPLVIAYNSTTDSTQVSFQSLGEFQLLEFSTCLPNSLYERLQGIFQSELFLEWEKNIAQIEASDKWVSSINDGHVPSNNSLESNVFENLLGLIYDEDRDTIRGEILDGINRINGLDLPVRDELREILKNKRDSESVLNVLILLRILDPYTYALMIPVTYSTSECNLSSNNVVVYLYASKESISKETSLFQRKIVHEVEKTNSIFSQGGVSSFLISDENSKKIAKCLEHTFSNRREGHPDKVNTINKFCFLRSIFVEKSVENHESFISLYDWGDAPARKPRNRNLSVQIFTEYLNQLGVKVSNPDGLHVFNLPEKVCPGAVFILWIQRAVSALSSHSSLSKIGIELRSMNENGVSFFEVRIPLEGRKISVDRLSASIRTKQGGSTAKIISDLFICCNKILLELTNIPKSELIEYQPLNLIDGVGSTLLEPVVEYKIIPEGNSTFYLSIFWEKRRDSGPEQ